MRLGRSMTLPSSALGSAFGALTRRSLVRQLCGAALAPALGAVMAGAAAETVSEFIVPYPPGGPGDVAARLMLPFLRQSMERTIIVENVPGVGGALAVQRLLAAAPNGTHLLLGTPNEIILAPLAFAAVKYQPDQLRLAGMVNRSPLVLVSGPQQSARTLAELLDAARRPGIREMSYGTSGVGSLFHLVSADFSARTGVPMLHVPYKGTAPMIQDLIGGQIDLAFVPTGGSVLDLIAGGKLRVFAVTSAERYAGAPTVPTMSEAIGLAPFDYELWGGVFLRREVGADLARPLNAAINQALRDPDYKRQVEALGGTVGAVFSLDEAERFLAAETVKYRRIAKAIKLDPQ